MTTRTIVRLSLVVCLAGVAACGDGLPTRPSPVYTLSGIVSTMTPTGSVPLAGVQITDSATQRVVKTDATGFYSIGVAAAATTISATKLGYVPSTSTRTINADSRFDIELDARATYILSGVVSEVTPAGLVPIEGLLVEVVSSVPRSTDHIVVSAETDANGHYSISGIWGGAGIENLIWLTKNGFDTQGNPSCDYCYRTFVMTADTKLDVQLERIK